MATNFSKNKSTNAIMILIIVVLLVAVINLSVTVIKINDLNSAITGYASSASGYVNLTIAQDLSINVSRAIINFGNGYINDTNANNASLKTQGDSDAEVIGGNWTNLVNGIIIQNLGNINFSLNASVNRDETDLFGSGSPRDFDWNFSNKKANTCSDPGEPLNVFRNVNKSASSIICNKFSFELNKNEMFLDVYLVVPRNTNNTGIALSSTISLIATAQV